MSGPPPKPTELKRLAGNPGKRPLNAAEPKPAASTARAPRGLGKEGGKFWRRYARALAGLKILTELDEPALQMAAEHYEIAVRAAHELRELIPLANLAGEAVLVDGQQVMVERGLLIRDRDGNLRKHPLLQVLRDNSMALKGYLTEMGMTPAARSKIKLQEEEQISMYDELFQKVQAASAPVEADPLDEFKPDSPDGG
jgi:phage terminase small subunit